jgi:uncharacterized membrane protein YgdD (TMEM256/DUF423 family)
MVRFWLITAAVLGLLEIILAAFGAHQLKDVLDEYGHTIYNKALLYQMFHALALLIVGILQHLFRERSFSVAGWGFLIGVLLYSGGLYILALTGIRAFAIVVPFGGVSFMIGWAGLAYTALKLRLDQDKAALQDSTP